MSARFIRLRAAFWWWIESRHPLWDVPFGLSVYRRRHRAEDDVVHRFGRNIYGQPMRCEGCSAHRYRCYHHGDSG